MKKETAREVAKEGRGDGEKGSKNKLNLEFSS